MDDARFAEFLRSLSSIASRRSIVIRLAASVFAAVLRALDADGTAAKEKKRKRKKKKKKKPASPPLSPPPPPPPTTKADAACPGPGDITIGVPGSTRLAQSFIPLASGHLVSVEVIVNKGVNENGAYIAHLATVDGSGVPTNTLLDTAMVPNGAVPANVLAPITFTFPSPALVTAGVTYALVFTRAGAAPDMLRLRAYNGDACVGAGASAPNESGPFSLFMNPPRDLVFTTFVSS